MAATKTAKMTTGLVRFSFCNVLKPNKTTTEKMSILVCSSLQRPTRKQSIKLEKW